MRVAIAVAALVCAPLFCVPAHAQRYVPSGGTVQLTFICHVNPDCSAFGSPTIRVTKPPEHGRVSISKTRDFCVFPPSNPRSACNTRRVSGVAMRYTAQRGYTGYDSVSAELFLPTGVMRSGTFNINVK